MDAQNRMLIYYLNALGQGLAGPKHPMQRVGAVTEQQIKAESQMKLIQKLLDSGGTVKRGKAGGIDVSGDVSYFISDIADEESIDKKNPFSGTMSEMSKDEQTSFKGGVTGRVESQRSLMEQKFLNPSSSLPDISGADLIGLTPENISQALQFKFMSEELEHKKLSDIMNMLAPTPGAPIETPGLGKLSLKQWNSLPTDDRSYYLYAASAKQRGEKVMTKENWMASTDVNTRIQYLEGLEEDEDLKSLAIELAQAGSVKIDIGEQVIQKGRSKDIVRVTSSTYAQEMRDDIAKDPERKLEEPYIIKYKKAGMDYEEAQIRARNAVLYDTMYKGLQIAYRKIGKKVTWGETGWEVDGVEVQGYP